VRIYRYRELVGRLERTGMTVMGSHHAHGLHAPYWWLRCLVGPTKDDHPAVAAYHRLLVWDIVKAPKLTRYTERVLNPLVGKSLVVYLVKPIVAVPAIVAAVVTDGSVDGATDTPADSGERTLAGAGAPV
jgi:hypothetical protein